MLSLSVKLGTTYSPSKNNKNMANSDSVAYILESYTLNFNERGLIAAQNYAQKDDLPMAVVAIIPASELSHPPLDGLHKIEKHLWEYNIPLLTMVGDRHHALQALATNMRPRLVMQDKALGTVGVTRHQIDWPKSVQPVDKLFAYAASHPEMCVF